MLGERLFVLRSSLRVASSCSGSAERGAVPLIGRAITRAVAIDRQEALGRAAHDRQLAELQVGGKRRRVGAAQATVQQSTGPVRRRCGSGRSGTPHMTRRPPVRSGSGRCQRGTARGRARGERPPGLSGEVGVPFGVRWLACSGASRVCGGVGVRSVQLAGPRRARLHRPLRLIEPLLGLGLVAAGTAPAHGCARARGRPRSRGWRTSAPRRARRSGARWWRRSRPCTRSRDSRRSPPTRPWSRVLGRLDRAVFQLAIEHLEDRPILLKIPPAS